MRSGILLSRRSALGAAPAAVVLPTANMTGRWRGDALTGAEADPITTWLGDVSSRNLTQATGGNKPTVRRAVVNGHDVARFDGGDFLASAALFSTLITAAAGTIYAVVKVTSISTSVAGPYDNVAIWGDTGGYLGQHLKSVGPVTQAYNYSGGNITKDRTIVLGQWHVISWRHHTADGLFCTVDGSTSTTAGGGNTDATGMGSVMRVGANYAGSAFLLGDIAELVTYNVGHDLTTEATAHTALKATYGIA